MEQLRDFFFWCLVVNSAVYGITALAVLVFKDFAYGMQRRLFGLSDEQISLATHRYLATYKLLITVFNFTPWLVLLII